MNVHVACGQAWEEHTKVGIFAVPMCPDEDPAEVLDVLGTRFLGYMDSNRRSNV